MDEIEFKQKIREILIKDEDIARGILNPSDQFIAIPSDTWRLKTEHIYDYLFIPDIQTETKSYIMFRVDFDYLRTTGMLPSVDIEFSILCHHTLQKTGEGYTRLEFLKRRIKELFNNNNNDFKAAKLKITASVDLLPLGEKYVRGLVKFTTRTI